MGTRRFGVVPTSTWAVRRRRPSRTTAKQGTRIGRRAGPKTRRRGVATTSKRDALRPHPSLTIVTQAIPTGRLGGAMTRKTGAAPTRRRAARSELAEETGSLHRAVLGPCASQVDDRGSPSALGCAKVSGRPAPSVTLSICAGHEETHWSMHI